MGLQVLFCVVPAPPSSPFASGRRLTPLATIVQLARRPEGGVDLLWKARVPACAEAEGRTTLVFPLYTRFPRQEQLNLLVQFWSEAAQGEKVP